MFMKPDYLLHITAGTISLVAGYTALYASKGAPVHRRAGTVFVATMLAMCASAIVLAIGRRAAPFLNVSAALLTASLVATSLTTVRSASGLTRAVERSATMLCLAVGVSNLMFGMEAARAINGLGRDGIPAFPFFMFGVVGTLAAVGDARVALGRRLQGSLRLARHLWRMTFALFVAALSFFIGQADVIPEPVRIRPLLALPVLAVLLTMFYWLWRVRVKQSVRGLRIALGTVPY